MDEKEIAQAEVMPRFYKFPFMQKNSLHIGPCWTDPGYRGNGLYPYLLTYIMNDNPQSSAFYIICTDTNSASKRGIEKAGFKLIGTGSKNALRVYKITRWLS